MEAWLTILEAAAPIRALRESVWVYPLVNAGHVLGVALLVGGIVPLDLRLLGAWATLPLEPLWRVLTLSAAAGLALAATCGALLFATRATEYAASSLFLAKMAIVAAATLNALALRHHPGGGTAGRPTRLRIGAALSLAGWSSALVLGRLVGYF